MGNNQHIFKVSNFSKNKNSPKVLRTADWELGCAQGVRTPVRAPQVRTPQKGYEGAQIKKKKSRRASRAA